MDPIIESASSYAGQIDNVILLIGFFTGAWLLLTLAVFFYFLIRYRAKPGEKALYIEGESHEEAKWVHWPHYAVIFCDVIIIAVAVPAWYHVKQELPRADATIRIIGQQWAWKFVHPGKDNELGTKDDIETVDELHLQADMTYHFKLESDDVMHDFSVPVFRLKQDAIPGRVITGWMKPTKAGEFDIQCAEMCGIGHGVMAAKLYVEEAAEHKQWIAGF
jgi:cytochrome c oxidase subunit II